jgi:hypothetical protein
MGLNASPAEQARSTKEAEADGDAKDEHEAAEASHQEKAARDGRDTPLRRYLGELLGQARAASDAHDCAVVTKRAISIRALDSEFYETVFMRDAVIQRCLDAGASTQPVPNESPAGSR